jgi:DNA-binding HxlR family transcriptional regulator
LIETHAGGENCATQKLERRGLLDRLVHTVLPPHVDYTLTPVGTKFAEAVALLCAWAQKNNGMLKRVNFND